MTANNDAALVREALERDGWRMKGGARDYTLREDALAALDRLAATAERADEAEAKQDAAEAGERANLEHARELLARAEAAEAALLAAQQERDEARKLLLSIEGAILGYWTDIPQDVLEKFRVKIRELLGDFKP